MLLNDYMNENFPNLNLRPSLFYNWEIGREWVEVSLASYIGCNVKIPLSDEYSDDLMVIGDCFSREREQQSVKKYQFTTPYVYEVSSHWGIKISEYTTPKICAESKMKLNSTM